MIKSTLMLLLICFTSFFIFNTYAKNVDMRIKGKEAKLLYNSLTGPKVHNEGAAGHLYRRAESIVCRYTNADVNGRRGLLPRFSPRRYECEITFNSNGHAEPGHL